MKKLLKLAFVTAIAAVAGYNVYQSQSVMNGMSDFALANVEALASGESFDKKTKIEYRDDEETIEDDKYIIYKWVDVVQCLPFGVEDCIPSRTPEEIRIKKERL